MKDRGMVKWQPFAALTGHDKYIKETIGKRGLVEKPVLMEDAQNELEYALNEALLSQNFVKVKYFKNGSFFEEKCKIVTIDTLTKRIYLDINIVLRVEDIVKIST